MRAAVLGVAVVLVACASVAGDDSGDTSSVDTSPVDTGDTALPAGVAHPLGPEAEVVRLEVDYEEGAAPYTGSVLLSGDTWDVFHTNLEALLAPTDVTLDAPHTLDEMSEFPARGRDSYTVADLLALSDEVRDDRGDATTASFHALWVDGYFERDGEVQTGVLGVSIGSTRVVAMFKPVIASLGPTQSGRQLGEQAVLVHELGHAIGLVENGVPAIADHHDAPNGAHCTDDRCVMYWALERGAGLSDFVAQQITGASDVLFGQDCLDDVSAEVDARRD